MKYLSSIFLKFTNIVAPFAGAWIEISIANSHTIKIRVAPFAGAWIEILIVNAIITASLMSLPSRERGLKSKWHICMRRLKKSLPSRERGLKSVLLTEILLLHLVAPFAGAWIEIIIRI